MQAAVAEIEWHVFDAIPEGLRRRVVIRMDKAPDHNGGNNDSAGATQRRTSSLNRSSTRERVVHKKDAVADNILGHLEVLLMGMEPLVWNGSRVQRSLMRDSKFSDR